MSETLWHILTCEGCGRSYRAKPPQGEPFFYRLCTPCREMEDEAAAYRDRPVDQQLRAAGVRGLFD